MAIFHNGVGDNFERKGGIKMSGFEEIKERPLDPDRGIGSDPTNSFDPDTTTPNSISDKKITDIEEMLRNPISEKKKIIAEMVGNGVNVVFW